MTFDDIKEMKIGSKKVKEAWLNGRQVYPSEKRIMDSLVCWYDIGKQQCTNESMAANPVLADLSGNGHDIECFNFGWAGMSGIGGYNVNFTNFITETEILKTQDKIIIYNTDESYNGILRFINAQSQGKISYPQFKLKISGLAEGETINYVYFDGENLSIRHSMVMGNGIYDIPKIEANITADDNKYCTVLTFNLNNIRYKNIVFEQLPLYPNALVSDGVDDYCYTDGLPILTDYTVIAKRKWLGFTGNCALASKFKNNGALTGAFGLEHIGTNDTKEYWSFGVNNRAVLYPEEITYGTPTLCNGVPVNRGNASDNEVLSLFSMRENMQTRGQIALYSFLLFDRTLTTAEIEWVKKNMIESGGVLKTDWMQKPWRRLHRDRITGTESSNVLKITSCTETQNFKESATNSYIPSFKIKVTGLKNGIRLIYINSSIVNFRIEEDGIYTLEEQEGDWIGFRFDKTFENENIVIQQLLSE